MFIRKKVLTDQFHTPQKLLLLNQPRRQCWRVSKVHHSYTVVIMVLMLASNFGEVIGCMTAQECKERSGA